MKRSNLIVTFLISFLCSGCDDTENATVNAPTEESASQQKPPALTLNCTDYQQTKEAGLIKITECETKNSRCLIYKNSRISCYAKEAPKNRRLDESQK
jgi:hypothetical protein